MINNLFIIFASLGVLFSFIWLLYKRYRSFDKRIISDLDKYSLRFKSSCAPSLFSKSPFSNFQIYDYHGDTSILGISGEEVFRRIVIFKDANGKQYKSWIEVQTRAFTVHKIKWEKELNKLSS